MPLTLNGRGIEEARIEKIGVIGAGIVGVPMAVLLAEARVRIGTDRAAPVVLIQRDSGTSGWKVDAVNRGRSPIGGIEPALGRLLAENVSAGRLRASHDYGELRDADVILLCVQTDKAGIAPDYGPLLSATRAVAEQLTRRPEGNVPLVVFESTLAPSSMATVIRGTFAEYGLVEGRDVLLGNSPNRVMPGRLVERIRRSDKVVAGLDPRTPELIRRVYAGLVTEGALLPTNSLTAETVKTLENAYRDVRIAYAAEVLRYCDERNYDFFALRDLVNQELGQPDTASVNPAAVPTGGLLVPTVGVGGHCLPKDGVLLWWRRLETEGDRARGLMLESRRINEEAPAYALARAERAFGSLSGKRVAILGAAYRADADDSRNSPSLVLAGLLRDRGAEVLVHDPFVHPGDQNLIRSGFDRVFTRDFEAALACDAIFGCTAHRPYLTASERILGSTREGRSVFDGCNALRSAASRFSARSVAGLGWGREDPPAGLVAAVTAGFRAIEIGVANEVEALAGFLNERYAPDGFSRVDVEAVRRIAGTCITGCALPPPGPIPRVPVWGWFSSRLVGLAQDAGGKRQDPPTRRTGVAAARH